MPRYKNQRSFIAGAPESGLFGILLPRGLAADDAHYFRRTGTRFGHQGGEEMGLGPLLRFFPLLAIAIAVAVGIATVIFTINVAEHLSPAEVVSCLVLGGLLLGMVIGISWLLRDLSRAAIVDTRQGILWLGGGWLGRWQALNFAYLSRIEVTRVAEDHEAEYPWGVEVVDLDGGRHRVCEELGPELAAVPARELAAHTRLPFAGIDTRNAGTDA